ncbi:hypothetical protein [Diaphorobacter caeni]|uniref:hypothetical protein n=1 Tax=Diaphorobacter caeni TaxID=2784387 RepID=UPI00188F56E4|nr:hypothetical protein [Diaphorobacter caeni]MBF5005777.1 hypothetical protein [Diaphorobacter caeni]
MNPVELRERILDAFEAVRHPERNQIAPHICEECNELADDFFPYKPMDIPPDVFHRHVWDMPLLSAEAKRYFFPAWLIYGLDASGPWLCDAASAVLYALTNSEHRWDPIEPYSREQWLAFQDWLSYAAGIADDIDSEAIEAAKERVTNEL